MGLVPQKSHAFVDLLRVGAEELSKPATVLTMQHNAAPLPVAEGSWVSINRRGGFTNTESENASAGFEPLAERAGLTSWIVAKKRENDAVRSRGRLDASFFPFQERRRIYTECFGDLPLI